MDNFSTVLAICRTALKSPNATLSRNVGRLADLLAKQAENEQSDALRELLDQTSRSAQLVPSRVILSSAAVIERMSASVHPPTDRETSAPLAAIVHPIRRNDVEQPILDESLRDAISSLLEEWKHAHELANAGVRPPLSLLMYGAPGTGKTVLAHSMAQEMNLPLVVARLDGLISSFLGTTARNIASLFEFANRYECILLLDEFDAVAKIRDDPHEVGEIKRVVNTLLQCLDGRKDLGFTIAITNHEQLLDSAIWRRFDTTIEIPAPGLAVRRRILERYMLHTVVDPVDIDFLAWLTEGRSGAQIEALCDSIKRYLIMNGADRKAIMTALKVNTLLNASIGSATRSQLVTGEPEILARELSAEESVRFTQESLARLFDTTQSTISRWIRK